MSPSVQYRSLIPAPAATVFRWHETPEALKALMPPGPWVRVEQRTGGVRDGDLVVLSMGLGPLRLPWHARHFGYEPDRQFCDEQEKGPFRRWRHTHRVQPIDATQCLYEDHIEYELPGPALVTRLVDPLVRLALRRMLVQRHAVVRATFTGLRRAAAVMVAALVLAQTAVATVRAQAPSSPPAAPVMAVPSVNLDRYLGDWYEVARFENRFQRRCTGDVRASYARRADGRIDVRNRCQTQDGPIDAKGVARPVEAGVFARLKVRFAPAFLSFLPFVWGDYWVIGLAEDYTWATVGSPDRKYLWLLSRTPALPESRYEAAVAAAARNGFDVSRLARTPQSDTR